MLEIRNWLKWEVGLFNIHASDRDSSSVSGLSSLSLLQTDSYFLFQMQSFLMWFRFFGDIILIDIIVFFCFY